MRQFFLGLSLSGAFVVGCVSGSIAQRTAAASPDNAPPEEVVPTYRRWEYHCTEQTQFSPEVRTPGDVEKLDAQLNALGADGWELVTSSQGGTMCFKRPL